MMNYLNFFRERYHRLESRDRLRVGIGIALLLFLAILFSTANARIGLLKKKLAAREADIAEMLALKQRYLEASSVARKLANRLSATRADDSPAKIVDEIGIKGKGSQIRPLKGEERGGFLEDTAEVKIDGVTANEAVNLLFRLEKGPRPVVIKKALLKTRFDDPARLDLTLTIALLKAASQGQR
jgi:general secretion pathway protein M